MVVWSMVLMLVGLWQGVSTPPGPSGPLMVSDRQGVLSGAKGPPLTEAIGQQLQKSRNEFLALHRSV